jgi:iron complex transport system substrate-binding protein
MRIVSLLPSATEILFALGLGDDVVGVSHECDFPAEARDKRVVIHSRIPKDAPPAEIDRLVRDYVSRGESVYAVDADALQELAPDLIVTQDLCHVCAASPDDLAAALRRFYQCPEVLRLNPHRLDDVWNDILSVGKATGREEVARDLVGQIHKRVEQIEKALGTTDFNSSSRSRVAFLEWLEPFYVGGHWVPEMIERAGGMDVFGTTGSASFRVKLEEIVAAAPDVLFISPCGYSAHQARQEYESMAFPQSWHDIPAVRNGRVFALEANSYFSRPGPRLITGLEALAKAFHLTIDVTQEAGASILSLAAANAGT